MSEELWFEEVEELIGAEPTGDGWYFAYENGLTPRQAINLVLGE